FSSSVLAAVIKKRDALRDIGGIEATAHWDVRAPNRRPARCGWTPVEAPLLGPATSANTTCAPSPCFTARPGSRDAHAGSSHLAAVTVALWPYRQSFRLLRRRTAFHRGRGLVPTALAAGGFAHMGWGAAEIVPKERDMPGWESSWGTTGSR